MLVLLAVLIFGVAAIFGRGLLHSHDLRLHRAETDTAFDISGNLRTDPSAEEAPAEKPPARTARPSIPLSPVGRQ